jgi:lipopolysaccharide transport system ATP-binding protein
MKVRLGFAVAAHLEPEILVVDEVLAVGDAEFQKKAVGKMQDVSTKDGRTILFVSHNMVAVQNLCSRVTILENGKLTFNGDVNKGINYYLSNNMQKIDSVPLSERKDRDGIGVLKFDAIELINESGDKVTEVYSGQKIIIKLKYSKERDFDDINFRIQFFDHDHTLRFLCNSLHTEEKYHRTANKTAAECIIQNFPLPEGEYFINIRARSQNLGILDDIEYATKLHVVGGDFYGTGKIPEITKGVLVNHFWE